jgi:tRNA threonylcarbamoyladenosine biosynthesis protein TsaB
MRPPMPRQLPRILAFDTSSQITAVAVCEGSRVLAVDSDDTPSDARHAELIFPKLRRCLAQAGLTLQEIDLIAVGVGPGSFTGLRVGVATAKGLGLALHKPVLPVSSLEALAASARAHIAHGWIAACVDAYKGELFAALYRSSEHGLSQTIAPFHAAPGLVAEQLAAMSGTEPVALVGAGVFRYPELLAGLPARIQPLEARAQFAAPPAEAIAALAHAAYQRGDVVDLAGVLPVYLRDCDAQLPKQPLRL